jgi:hypothetical protein
MSELNATLILVAVAALLVPLGVWIIRAARRSRGAFAPLVGMLMLLGAFYPPDPPPPPPGRERRARRGRRAEGSGLGRRIDIQL